jgi:hypothetical protein
MAWGRCDWDECRGGMSVSSFLEQKVEVRSIRLH